MSMLVAPSLVTQRSCGTFVQDAVAQFSSFTAEDAAPGAAPKKPAAAGEKPAEKQPAAAAAPAAAAPKPSAKPKAAAAAPPAGVMPS